ncbi:ComF family protein [Catenovulum sp. SX2]|uniref:ComF family protein n=1 Tax=Catenovulum sp. SX2 TaxID=3398614 RepID=UPI003F83199E
MELQNYFSGLKKLPAILAQVCAKLPSQCFSCKSATQAQHLVCLYCLNDWQLSSEYLAWQDITSVFAAQKSMQIDELEHIFCLTEHISPVSELISNYKYRRDLTARTALAQLLSASFSNWQDSPLVQLQSYDYLLPVPMHFTALWLRGFNQSKWLAEQIGLHTQVQVLDALRKTQATQHQARLSGGARRLHKQNIYAVKAEFVEQVKGKRILLVDDVVTTGTTLNSIATCLLDYGVSVVAAATLSWAKLK